MNEDFSDAIRIVLTVALNQLSFQRTTRDDLTNVLRGSPARFLMIIDRLVFAEILTSESNTFRLARSPFRTQLAEIYAAVLPPSKLPRTNFDHLYASLAEKTERGVIKDFGTADLGSAITDVLVRSGRLPPAGVTSQRRAN